MGFIRERIFAEGMGSAMPIKKHISRFLHGKIGYLLANGKRRKALDLLDDLIEDTVPLFEGQDWVLEERRLAWLYRIEVLREWGKLSEALAWACLEVEMNPENVAAIALRERLKKESGLIRSAAPVQPITAAPEEISLWHGVAGMRDLKAMLERDVVLPFQEPEIYERYRLTLPNGILLYGPPGCGKTFIARKLADVLGFSFVEVKPGDLASIYVHGTQGKIADLFKQAEADAPSILFFDELDAMVPARQGDSVGHHYASEVNEFLVQLNDCSARNILVVGATNLIDRIDAAVLRPGRLDKKFFVTPPDYEARVELLKLYMKGRPQQAIDWNRCALELENYTCAEIEYIVNEAARVALDNGRDICTTDLVGTLSENPPDHTVAMIDSMRRKEQP
jgi:SpoVK/Ycf46/Vps4 family AAA+-type ATPase